MMTDQRGSRHHQRFKPMAESVKSGEKQWPVRVPGHNNVSMSISLGVQESHEQVAWRNGEE